MIAKHKDYSATPLYKKLGIKDESRVAVVNEPESCDGLEVPEGVRFFIRASEPLDVVVLFTTSEAHLRRRFGVLKLFIASAGGLWIAYPKKSSTIATDLTFEAVQKIGLEEGLVDNKSCALDEDWSAVRFVYRLSDRKGAAC